MLTEIVCFHEKWENRISVAHEIGSHIPDTSKRHGKKEKIIYMLMSIEILLKAFVSHLLLCILITNILFSANLYEIDSFQWKGNNNDSFSFWVKRSLIRDLCHTDLILIQTVIISFRFHVTLEKRHKNYMMLPNCLLSIFSLLFIILTACLLLSPCLFVVIYTHKYGWKCMWNWCFIKSWREKKRSYDKICFFYLPSSKPLI